MKNLSFPRQLVVIAGLSLIASVLSAVFHPKRPSWYRVSSPEELRWQIELSEVTSVASKGEILWVDAREREKFEENHLPGAILLNLAEWSELMFQNMETLQDAFDRPVVVYCDTDSCGKSREVAKRLRELIGLDPVYVLKGNWRELDATESIQ